MRGVASKGYRERYRHQLAMRDRRRRAAATGRPSLPNPKSTSDDGSEPKSTISSPTAHKLVPGLSGVIVNDVIPTSEMNPANEVEVVEVR